MKRFCLWTIPDKYESLRGAPKPYFLNNREAAPVPALAQPAEVAVKAPKISLPLLSGLEEIEAM